MTFDQVLVFHKIVQCGSFKSAAEELHKTQPAISLAIKKLEEEMEVDLFNRSSYRPVLTEFGKSFYEKSLKILLGMKELESLTDSFKNQEEPEIKLAIDGISPLPNLLKIFKKFSDRYIHTKLDLEFDILFEVEKKVQTREVSMGITHFMSDPSTLDSLSIGQVVMTPVINSALFREKQISHQQQLLEIDQIVLGGRVEKKGQSFGLLEGGRKWRVTDNNFKREIILAGLGWGHLPFHIIQRELEEGILTPLEFENIHPKTLEIFLIRLKKHQFGPVANSLWSQLSTLHGK